MSGDAQKGKRALRIAIYSAAAIIGLLIIITVAISLYAAHAMTRFERKPLSSNPAEVGLSYEEISFQSRDGLALSGWWIDAGGSNRVVVIVHGSEGNRVRPPEKMLGIAKELVTHRYNVLMYDMRGHGESEAKHVSAGLYEKYDLLGAVDHAKRRGMHRIGVIGFSLGAATSLMVLADTADVDAVVSDSGYADLTDIIESEFGERSNLPRFFIPLILFTAKVLYDVDFAAVKPIDAVRMSDVPVFVIHGAQDEMVPVEHAYRLADASKNPDSLLWVLEDAGHSNPYLVRPEEYSSRMLSFFDKALQ